MRSLHKIISTVRFHFPGAVVIAIRGDIPFERLLYRERLHYLCEAQNWRCCYCGVRMVSEAQVNGPDDATIDHVQTASNGGSDEWRNLAAACRLCNNGRGALHAKQYFSMVRKFGRKRAVRIAARERARVDRARTMQAIIEKACVPVENPAACP